MSYQIAVGNTYRHLSDREAPLDRSGSFRKNHDVTFFVDVPSTEAADMIAMVLFDFGPTFQPSKFACHAPIPAKATYSTEHGSRSVMRFASRQTLYGAVPCGITVRCRGGTALHVEHTPTLTGGGTVRPTAHRLQERRPLRPLRPVKLPDDSNFGIELELTSATQLSPDDIAAQLRRGVGDVRVMTSYSQGQRQIDGWKLVPDASISCNISQPDCNTFELVSPVLRGGHGLGEVSKIANDLALFRGQVKVNKSMGYHVHIDVSDLTLSQLVKVCQNFVKYERVMDRFFPPSRRTGSEESDRYFRSNRASVAGDAGAFAVLTSNREVHDILAWCESIADLADVMNRGGTRYYKLNLQNLVSGRQPTIEFRQHSATASYDKISAWVRFCSRFVANSAKLAPPSPFSSSTGLDRQTDALFYYVIKDRALRNFYFARIDELAAFTGARFEGGASACCSGCAKGGACGRR
jgi:hypothetical protein